MAPSHRGIRGASAWKSKRPRKPVTRVASTPWRMICRARSSSPAPMALDTCTEYPTPTPTSNPPDSQMGAAFTDTAAVPAAPMTPTIAVST